MLSAAFIVLASAALTVARSVSTVTDVDCSATVPCHCRQVESNTYVVCSRVTDPRSLLAVLGGIPLVDGELPWLRVLNSSMGQLGTRAFGDLHVQSLQINASNLSAIADDAFLGLDDLIALALQDNLLRAVPSAALRHLHKLQTLSLAGNNIERIESGAFSQLHGLNYLSLADNLIENISPNAFPETMQHLSMANNQLTRLGSALHRLRRLTFLMMSKNLLTELKHEELGFLSNLEIFICSHNRVTKAHKAFHNLQMLDSVYLKHNQLRSLEGVFVNLSSLRKVSVAYNQLHELDANTFESVPLLHELNLSHNNIKFIDSTAFSGCPNLADLYLSHNQIHNFPNSALEKLQQLVVLDLSHNRLANIHGLKNLHLPALKHLHLAGNHIKSLPADLLSHIPALLQLNLSYNSLVTLEPNVFGHHALRRLRIEGNPLQCDEDLMLMLDELEVNGTHVHQKPQCLVYPSHLNEVD